MIATYQHYLMISALAILAAIGAAFALHRIFGPVLRLALDAVRASVWRSVLLGAFVCTLVYYGATKGTVSYPFTDPEVRYLYDNGSYVTNDAVHIAFSRMIAPSSAPLFIDCRALDQTNDTDWVTVVATTFAAFDVPQDLPFPAATNYNWIVYTTWTPGLTVRTNGVWHAYWGVDRKSGTYFIPVRTCVKDGGTVIATPKSRWDAGITNEWEEVIYEGD